MMEKANKRNKSDVEDEDEVSRRRMERQELAIVPKAPVSVDPSLFTVATFYSNSSLAQKEQPMISQLNTAMMEACSCATCLVPWSEKVENSTELQSCLEQQATDVGKCYGLEGLRDPFEGTWDKGVRQLYGETLLNLNIPRILLYTDIISDKNVVIPQKVDLVFIAQPAVQEKGMFVASTVNRCGRSAASPSFWTDQLEHRMVAGTEKAILHLAVRVPSCLHPEEKREEHEDAAARLDVHGHGIGARFQYATFWGKTAEAFVMLADSAIVQAGRCAGFQPLYALKDGFLQNIEGKYGVRGYKFTSVDNFAVSEVVLLGFWKQYSERTSDHVLLSLEYNTCPLTASIEGGVIEGNTGDALLDT